MKRAYAVAGLALATRPAFAEPNWQLTAAVQTATGVELDDGAPSQRVAVMPAMSLDAGRELGPVVVHVRIRAGFPAYYGQHAAGVGVSRDFGLGLDMLDTANTRLAASIGLEAGATIGFHDAPPDLPADSTAVVYWGPYARAGGALHLLWLAPSEQPRWYGVVLTAGAGVVDARYRDNRSGDGIRLELDLGIGLEIRL